MELNNHQFPKPLVLEYQATNRLLLAASKEYGDSDTTQKKDVKKTPATMLPSTLKYVHYKLFLTMASKFES